MSLCQVCFEAKDEVELLQCGHSVCNVCAAEFGSQPCAASSLCDGSPLVFGEETNQEALERMATALKEKELYLSKLVSNFVQEIEHLEDSHTKSIEKLLNDLHLKGALEFAGIKKEKMKPIIKKLVSKKRLRSLLESVEEKDDERYLYLMKNYDKILITRVGGTLKKEEVYHIGKLRESSKRYMIRKTPTSVNFVKLSEPKSCSELIIPMIYGKISVRRFNDPFHKICSCSSSINTLLPWPGRAEIDEVFRHKLELVKEMFKGQIEELQKGLKALENSIDRMNYLIETNQTLPVASCKVKYSFEPKKGVRYSQRELLMFGSVGFFQFKFLFDSEGWRNCWKVPLVSPVGDTLGIVLNLACSRKRFILTLLDNDPLAKSYLSKSMKTIKSANSKSFGKPFEFGDTIKLGWIGDDYIVTIILNDYRHYTIDLKSENASPVLSPSAAQEEIFFVKPARKEMSVFILRHFQTDKNYLLATYAKGTKIYGHC